MTKKTTFPKRAMCALLAAVMLMGASFAYFSDYVETSVTGTAGTVDIELNSNINLLDANGQDIINPGDKRDASLEVVNMGNKSVDVKTEIILSVASNFDHDLTLSGDSATQSEYDLYYASDVELVEGEGWKPKAGAKPVAEKVIAEDGKSITYTLPVYALNGNSNEHDEVETIDGVDTFVKSEDIVMLMNGQAGNLWQNSTVSIATKVYAKQHENTSSGWDLVSFDAVDNVENGEGNLVIDTMTTYGTRVGNIGVTVSQVMDNGAAASTEGEGQFDVVEVGKFTTTKTDKINIEDLKAGTYVITTTSTPSGYTVENDAVVVITKDKTTKKTLNVGVNDTDNIVYNTVDVDGNKLSNVAVTVETANEYGEYKTNNNGVIVLNGLKSSTEYTISAPEKVGELPIVTSSTIKVKAGESDTSIYGIEKDKVYASLIGDTVYIATYEISELDGVKATEIRNITNGGQVSTKTSSVKKAVIVDEITPMATKSWFFTMSQLTEIENLNLINLSKVTDMSNMFYGCSQLTSVGDLSDWSVDNVVNMSNMFYRCGKLTSVGDLSDWDVSNVVSMKFIFSDCTALTSLGDLNGWDVANVTDMSCAFQNCKVLTPIGALSGWDVGGVTNMSNMFLNCSLFDTLDLTDWDVSNVTNMSGMLSSCTKLTSIGDISTWSVGKVRNMSNMFRGLKLVTSLGDLSDWDMSKVTNTSGMFYNCAKVPSFGDLSGWNISNVTDMNTMFMYCNKLTTVGDISGWSVGNVTNMNSMFAGCFVLTTPGDLSNWDMGKVIKTSKMFYNCFAVTSIGDISEWNMDSVTDMSSMFYGCSELTSVGDLNNWNVSSATKTDMFYGCSKLTTKPTWYVA